MEDDSNHTIEDISRKDDGLNILTTIFFGDSKYIYLTTQFEVLDTIANEFKLNGHGYTRREEFIEIIEGMKESGDFRKNLLQILFNIDQNSCTPDTIKVTLDRITGFYLFYLYFTVLKNRDPCAYYMIKYSNGLTNRDVKKTVKWLLSCKWTEYKMPTKYINDLSHDMDFDKTHIFHANMLYDIPDDIFINRVKSTYSMYLSDVSDIINKPRTSPILTGNSGVDQICDLLSKFYIKSTSTRYSIEETVHSYLNYIRENTKLTPAKRKLFQSYDELIDILTTQDSTRYDKVLDYIKNVKKMPNLDDFGSYIVKDFITPSTIISKKNQDTIKSIAKGSIATYFKLASLGICDNIDVDDI